MPPCPASRPATWPLLYLAVALTTAATFALELSLTRILAVVLSDDSAFLVMTIAVLGLGVGGVLSFAFGGRSSGICSKLGFISLLTAVLALASLSLAVSASVGLGKLQFWVIAIVSALPFIASGLVLAWVICEMLERVCSVCCFALLGAAGGCVSVVGLLHAVGGSNTIVAVSVVYVAAGAIWFSIDGRRRGRIFSVAVALFFTILVMGNSGYRLVEIRYAKGHVLDEKPYVKWNSYSRVSMGAADDSIYVDGERSSLIATREQVLHAGPGLAYRLRPGGKVLIVEPGGGLDVVRALSAGSRDVTGVQVNAVIGKTIMQQKFPELSDRLYLRPEVHIFIEEGLSFIRKGDQQYRVIQIHDGPLSPDEIGEYFSHLSSDGILALDLGPNGIKSAGGREAMATGSQILITRKAWSEGDLNVARESGARPLIEAAKNRFAWPATWIFALAISGVAVIALVLWPAFTLSAEQGVRGFLPSFLVIGMGYVMITYAVVEQFALFLGHPTYGLTVVLFAMLVGYAAGSYISQELLGQGGSRLRLALVGVAVLAAVVAMVAGTVLSVCASWPLATRIVASVVVVVPLGFALGLPFPSALRMLGERNVASLRWAWSLHAVAVVFGFVAAVLVARNFGMTVVMLTGGGMYLLALAGAGVSSLVRGAEAAVGPVRA